ncbi:MAG TPA: ketopantoate reductase family protein [Steroidobacteraceae bacterium]
MRLLVIGAGSTGGYFGGRLASAGRDVTFLVRAQRAAQLRAHGLQILSPHGDFTLAPRILLAADLEEHFDAVLLTVKAFSLQRALEDFAPAVGPGTMILPVLNGMRHVDVLTARFGRQALIGCICKVATTLDAAGRIVQLAGFQELAYGEMNGEDSARIRELDAFMQGAGFHARLSRTIEREMWEKWALLAAMGGMTCLMRGTIGEIQAAADGPDFAQRFIDEVVAVISAVGVAPDSGTLAAIKAFLTERGSNQASSMYRDLQRGQPIELEQIIGDLLARARQAAIATPLLSAAYTHLSIYQSRLG